jgi:hypothetical protein
LRSRILKPRLSLSDACRSSTGRSSRSGGPRFVFRRLLGRLLVGALTSAIAAGAASSARADAVPLVEAIPAESFALVAWRSEPEKGLADRHLENLRDAIADIGAFDVIVAELREDVGPEDLRSFELEAQHWQGLFRAVAAWELIRREVAIGARIGPTGRIELLAALRAESVARRDDHLLALRRILHGVAAVFGDYEIVEGDRQAVPTTVLYGLGDPGDQICLGGHEDVVLISTSAQFLRQSIELLDGRGSERPLVHGKTYRESAGVLHGALGEDAEPESGAAVAWAELWFRPGEPFEGVPSIDVVTEFHLRAVDRVSRLDWALVHELKKSDENLLDRAFADQADARDLSLHVPVGERSWKIESGARPNILYDYLAQLVEQLSGGPLLPELIQRAQNASRFDLREDLLRHLSGRTLWYDELELGAGTEKSVAGVRLHELANTDTAVQLIEQIDRAIGRIRELGLTVERVPLDGVSGVLYVIDTSPFLGRPIVVGVAGSSLLLSDSRESAIDVARRRESGVRPALDEGRLPEDLLGVLPPGLGDRLADRALDEAYFTREGDSCSGICSLLRLFGALGQALPRDGGAGFLRPAFALAQKIPAVLRTLDFIGDAAGWVVRDGRKYEGRGTMVLRGRSRL